MTFSSSARGRPAAWWPADWRGGGGGGCSGGGGACGRRGRGGPGRVGGSVEAQRRSPRRGGARGRARPRTIVRYHRWAVSAERGVGGRPQGRGHGVAGRAAV